MNLLDLLYLLQQQRERGNCTTTRRGGYEYRNPVSAWDGPTFSHWGWCERSGKENGRYYEFGHYYPEKDRHTEAEQKEADAQYDAIKRRATAQHRGVNPFRGA